MGVFKMYYYYYYSFIIICGETYWSILQVLLWKRYNTSAAVGLLRKCGLLLRAGGMCLKTDIKHHISLTWHLSSTCHRDC